MSKGIDSVFLHYGVRRDDMALIEQAHHKKVGTKLPACLKGIEWQ